MIEVRLELLKLRSRMLQAVRSWFLGQGFTEIDVPVTACEVIPESHIRPFTIQGPSGETSGSRPVYLLPSPELHLKPVLASGAEKIFTITKAFRQGECGSYHLPEFTMLEWYRADSDYQDLMDDCQNLLIHVLKEMGRRALVQKGKEFRPQPPFETKTVSELFLEHAGWNPIEIRDPDRFDMDMVHKVEPALSCHPAVFVKDFPPWQASLSRLDPEGRFAQRVELYAAGMELANGFSELMDPERQRARFMEELSGMGLEGRAMTEAMPEHFLKALKACPGKASGMALGLDRLFMLISGIDDIADAVPLAPRWLC